VLRDPARITASVLFLLSALIAVGPLRLPVVALAQDRAPARYGIVPERSEVRYRVREQLVGVNFHNDAVGSTNAIAGAIVLDAQGRVVPGESRFSVDLRTLKSNEARRDNYLRRSTLETETYPNVTFVPTEARRLPFPLPPSGSVPFQLVGDLTVKNVTRQATWDATASFDGPMVTVRARTAFHFGDFGLRQPRVSVVLSIEDDIKLEADLVLHRGA
jgi:polyisoprenoid-binding protein YceI